MSLFESEFEMKIAFHDLDPMDVVWHGNYVKYMEQARCDMLNKLGYNYYNMKDDGWAYPVAKMKTKFIRPLTYNQEVKIVTSLEEIEPTMVIKYKIFDNKTGDKVFEGETVQFAVLIETRETIYSAPSTLKKILGVKDEV
ncbi:acyl-CoA thioesterase [bacterium]|nr:acyl-CoA thioesterase [bacterium]